MPNFSPGEKKARLLMKRKSPVFVKILACLLLLGSFASFLLPWMKLSTDVGPDQVRMSPGEIIQNFLGQDAETTKHAALEGLRAAGMGDPVTAKAAWSLLDRILDGRFRPLDLSELCRDGATLCRSFQRPDVAQTLDLAGWAVWGVFGLLALLGLIALICQLTDHRGGIVPYFLLGALLAGGLLYLRRELNTLIVQQADTYLEQWGISILTSYFQVDPAIVKMGIGAYLCPFLALLAFLFMGIKKKGKKPAAPSPYPARRAPGTEERSGARVRTAEKSADPEATVWLDPPRESAGWTCPRCRKRLTDRQAFCDACGQKRPAAAPGRNCPSCGAKLPEDAVFCPACGVRVRAAEQSPLPKEQQDR